MFTEFDSGEDKMFICYSNLWSLPSLEYMIRANYGDMITLSESFRLCQCVAVPHNWAEVRNTEVAVCWR